MPVPPVVGLCTDEAVTGAPFYVMRFVDGLILRDPEAVEPGAGTGPHGPPPSRWSTSLAALHAVDPDAVGLGDLGRQDGYVERTLRRWRGQWEKSKTREIPLVEEVADRLAADIPAAGPARIVHGDYRLDNTIVSPDDGSVQAVLDWELCTLGDPLADVGMLLVYWAEPGDDFSPLVWAPTAGPGLPRPEGGRRPLRRRLGAGPVGDRLLRRPRLLEDRRASWRASTPATPRVPTATPTTAGKRFEDTVPQLAEAADEAARRAGR